MIEITEAHKTMRQKQVEDALRRLQRLEARQQLVRGIAHDFNNQLTVILGNEELVGRLLTIASDADV